jgi:hypothetical protein
MNVEARLRAERALATGRLGLGASLEDLAVAALVAGPFVGTFGVALSWATWWPNPVIWAATALVLAAGTAWTAGHRMEGPHE